MARSAPGRFIGSGSNLYADFASLCSSSDPMDHVDDEYSRAGVHDPKILLTTSRDPSSKLQQFSKVRLPSFSSPLPLRLRFEKSGILTRKGYSCPFAHVCL